MMINVDNNGNETWSQINSTGLVTSAEGLTQNSAGEIILVGSIATQNSAPFNFDCYSAKISADGQIIWENQYNSPNGLDDLGDAIAIDANDNVIVACHSNTGTSDDINYHLVLLALNGATGDFANSAVFAASDSINVCNDIAISNNQIIAAGSLWQDATQRDILVVKYALSVGMGEIGTTSFEIYPNPTSSNITIDTYDLSGIDLISVFDQFGQLVHTQKPSGIKTCIDTASLSQGMYSVSISSTTNTIRKNFIKL
jgi:hypothetical protein